MTTAPPPKFVPPPPVHLSLLCTYAFYCGEALLKSCEQRSYITLSCGRMQELSCECINFDIEIKSQTRKKKKIPNFCLKNLSSRHRQLLQSDL